MTQTRRELEKMYETPDPWGYQTNPEDAKRKQTILEVLNRFNKGVFNHALDICCGEGWITQDLPAHHLHGYELCDNAAARMPGNVVRIHQVSGSYDLVVLTGALYAHYAWQDFVNMINNHASGIILLCNIKDWEVPEAIKQIPGNQIYSAEFPYREFVQKLRVFKRDSPK